MMDDEESGWSKINIKQSVDDLIRYGPGLKIGIAAFPYVADAPKLVLAQIDTGASGTGISPKLVAELGLVPHGPPGEIREAGRDPIIASYFRVGIFLPSIPEPVELKLEVVGLPSLPPPHDILIGRDVLSRCKLGIDFIAGRTKLQIKHSSENSR